MKLKNFKNYDLVISVFLFLAALVYYKFTFLNPEILISPNTYQSRDLKRAVDIYFNHVSIWHGPELSGGGFSPGPFYYYLIGLPYYLSKSLMSVYWLESLLAAFGISFLWLVLKRQYSLGAANLFYLIFLSSPFYQSQLLAFVNPSFQILFLFISIICFLNRSRIWYLVFAGIFLGLTLQMHVSAVALLAAYAAAILSGRDETIKQKLKSIAIVSGAVALSCSYYLIYKFLILPPDPSYDISKGFFRVMHSFLRIQNGLSFQSLTNFARMFASEFYIIPAVALLAMNFKKQNYESRFFAGIFIFSGIFVFHLVAAIGLARHIVPFMVACGLYYSIKIFQIENSKLKQSILLLSGFAIVFNFMGWGIRPDFKSAFNSNSTLSAQQQFIQKVVETTGWDFAYFQNHSYFYGIDSFEDFSFTYPYFASRTNKNNSRHFNGLIALPAKTVPVEVFNDLKLTNSLKPYLPDNIYKSLLNREIECKQVEETPHFQICFYTFSDEAKPRRWANVGFPYDYRATESVPEDSKAGVRQISENEAVIYSNDCGYSHSECFVFFHLKILPAGELKLEVTGAPVSSFDPYNFPRWTWGISEPRLLITCEETSEEHVITSGLGLTDYNRRSLSAPFDEYYKMPCKSPKSITIKSDSASSILILKSSGKHFYSLPFSMSWERRQ